MPSKTSNVDGIKQKTRSKADKARRTFELNGTYSSKHLRIREQTALSAQAAEPQPTAKGKGKGKGR